MCQNVCQNKQQQGGKLVDKLRGPRGGTARSRGMVLMIFKVRVGPLALLVYAFPKKLSEQLNSIHHKFPAKLSIKCP